MKTGDQFNMARRILSVAILLAIFLGVFGAGRVSPVHAKMSARNDPSQPSTVDVLSGNVLSDGQFVYGPNVGDFNVKTYLEAHAPHLSNYADALYGRSEYYSINPKIYLTLLEVHSHLISAPEPALMEDPLGLNNGDLIVQIESLSEKMSEAYYLHLYTYSPLTVSQRTLEPFVTPGGITISVAPEINAGTYAIIAGLAAMNEKNLSLILDNSQINGFYQTYRRLFAGDASDDPLDETNHISIPGTIPDNLLHPLDAVLGAAAPDKLLQLPYLQGLSWKFGGVHNTSGGTTFTDASSLDFYPSGSTWGIDTSNMWVVAAASGIPTRYSDCGFKISHSGAVNTGWETTYYHLEGAKYLSGSINQNDKIGVIANTEAEATCTGGAASGPHVHFSLKYDGAYVAINGTPLSGWYVHSGRYSYDVDHNYMWLEKAGVKKYAYGDLLLSEGVPVVISGNIGVAGEIVSYTGGTATTDSNGNYSITVPSGWTGTVTPSSPCYTYTPLNRNYTNILSDRVAENYAPSALDPTCAIVNVEIGGVNQGNYLLASGESIMKKYTLDGGPVEISSNNGMDIVASLYQWRRRPGTTPWTGITQSMALPVELITNQYMMPRYDYTSPSTMLNQVLIANVDTVTRDITVKIGANVMGTYTLAPSASQYLRYDGVVGGPVVVSSVTGAKIVASLYALIRDPSLTGWIGQSEMMGLPGTQLSDKYLIPMYFGASSPNTLRPYLYIANADTIATTVEVKIAGVSQGTYPLNPNTSTVTSYPLDGGPVEISSNNGAKIVASLYQLRRRPGTTPWTGAAQSMALPVELITNQYVMPLYDYTSPTTLFDQVLIANVDTVTRDITVKIGANVMGTYTLAPSASQYLRYNGVVGGPVVVSSVLGAKIVASLYELIRDPSLTGWIGQSEMMGLPGMQLSDKYLIPMYFGASSPNTLQPSLYIGVP